MTGKVTEADTLFAEYTTVNGNQVPVISEKDGVAYLDVAEKTVANGGKYITLNRTENGTIDGAAYSKSLKSTDFVTVFGSVDTTAEKVTTDAMGNEFVSTQYGAIGSVAAKDRMHTVENNPANYDQQMQKEREERNLRGVNSGNRDALAFSMFGDVKPVSATTVLSTTPQEFFSDDISPVHLDEISVGQDLDYIRGRRDGSALHEVYDALTESEEMRKRRNSFGLDIEYHGDDSYDGLDLSRNEATMEDLQYAVLELGSVTLSKADAFRDEFDEAMADLLSLS